MLGHKISLSRHKKTDILSSNFSEHNAMRLEINYKKKKKKTSKRNTNTWRLTNMPLNKWITKEIKEVKKYL